MQVKRIGPSLWLLFAFLVGLSWADLVEGKLGVLSNPDYQAVLGAADEASLNEFYALSFKAHESQDPKLGMGLKKMLQEGKVVQLTNGTTVRVVRVGSWLSQVEILTGDSKNRMMFVPKKFVVESK